MDQTTNSLLEEIIMRYSICYSRATFVNEHHAMVCGEHRKHGKERIRSSS